VISLPIGVDIVNTVDIVDIVVVTILHTTLEGSGLHLHSTYTQHSS